jgi:hypothetical protein
VEFRVPASLGRADTMSQGPLAAVLRLHVGAKDGVHARLPAAALSLEPVQHVGVDSDAGMRLGHAGWRQHPGGPEELVIKRRCIGIRGGVGLHLPFRHVAHALPIGLARSQP